jgi:transposase-like protein
MMFHRENSSQNGGKGISMTRKQNNADQPDWKEILTEQEDWLGRLIQEVVQQVLEAEMEEAVGAQKSERTPEPSGYRLRSDERLGIR